MFFFEHNECPSSSKQHRSVISVITLITLLICNTGPVVVNAHAVLASPRAAFRRPKAVPSASGRVPETAWALETAQDQFFRRFWIGLGWIFVEFWTSFRRFTLEPRATKAQKQNLKKESRDPQRTSWLLRCAVASYCSHVFRNYFRTLRVQPFLLRTHKLT